MSSSSSSSSSSRSTLTHLDRFKEGPSGISMSNNPERRYRSYDEEAIKPFGFNRDLSKIDSRIPQDTLVIERSKIGDINAEPGTINFM